MSAEPIVWDGRTADELEALAREAEAQDGDGRGDSYANATAHERPVRLRDAAITRAHLREDPEFAFLIDMWESAGDSPTDIDARLRATYGVTLASIRRDTRGWRTLADVSDAPPGPLLFGMLEDGPTLAYAAPGVGKGTTGAWLCCEAQRAGMLPLVFDAERRPREWSRRVGGLGGDRSRVVYVESVDLPTTVRGRPLWDIAPAIGEIAKAAGADVLIVDSIMPAVAVGEDRLRSDAQVPFLYVGALDALGMPSLSFGHPPKGQPEGDPFGSFAWVAAMRLTWLGTMAEGDGHRIRWRVRKRNERGHIPGVLLTVSYADDGRPCGIERVDDEESTRDWLLAALVSGPRSVSDLADDMLAEMENAPAGELERIRERLGKALRRMSRDGWVAKEGSTRGARWALRFADGRP